MHDNHSSRCDTAFSHGSPNILRRSPPFNPRSLPSRNKTFHVAARWVVLGPASPSQFFSILASPATGSFPCGTDPGMHLETRDSLSFLLFVLRQHGLTQRGHTTGQLVHRPAEARDCSCLQRPPRRLRARPSAKHLRQAGEGGGRMKSGGRARLYKMRGKTVIRGRRRGVTR